MLLSPIRSPLQPATRSPFEARLDRGSPPPPATWTVLNSAGASFTVSLTVLNSLGASFNVLPTVLNSSGASFTPV